MKDELGRKIMTDFSTLRPTTYSYLTAGNDESKLAKGKQKCVIKGKLKSGGYKNRLEANQLEKEIKHIEKNKLDTDGSKENDT